MDDPIGQAIKDFFENGEAPDVSVNTNYTEDETIPPSWFFRTEKELPEIESSALENCRGKILDVGAGAGSHALILQEKGFDVTALEISEMACQVMQKRGVENIVCTNLFNLKNKHFDTILVLMNGTGIGGTLKGLKKMLLHMKSLLNENGQILIDSSDILYLFEEEDGSVWTDLASENYYGEMEYQVKYKNLETMFNWLFTDFETLKNVAQKAGLQCSLIKSGEHYDFLARLCP